MFAMNLTRRAMIAATAFGLAALPALAQAQTVRFSTAGPAGDFLYRGMEMMAQHVADADVGLTVETYPSSSLFRQGTEVPAIQRGNLEMSTMAAPEISGQIPSWGFLSRAFLFRDYDHMMEVMSGPIGEQLTADVAEEMGIEILAVAYLGTRQVALREARDVTGPEDLNGVRLRMPGSPEWLLLGESLGVEPTPMAMPEVYVALQTGAIDGQENPLTIFNAARFHEVSEQVLLTSHMVQPVFFAISKPFFDALTDEQQQVLRDGARIGAEWNNEQRRADEMSVAERLVSELGLRVDEIDLSAFYENADAVYASSDLAEEWNADLMNQVMGR
ncbi:TRAP transporter substrate-binding protein DctP [Rhodobacter sp. NTK016B]|uniref:TRAP transporter substrate-binding protein DctP n=1 Tax=Rhodobacter sp. NTK016B TaxID=2759676 RepID=UPI001A8FB36A|nr:TRAP transporter substrate-binding protein DctP [Rhodobacter sp. NTK016B]MBN8293378.1 TRAP transporter substrate-binding protein DctP [Rhodobacter sp. NTK016B]